MHKEITEADEETEEEQKALVPVATHVNKILLSIFTNGEVYIKNQQIQNLNGLHMNKS